MRRPPIRSVAAIVLLAALAPPAALAAAGPSEPQPILESQKLPEFPPAAKAGRFSGVVMLEAVVLADGSVGEVKVLGCTRPKVGFEEAAVTAVKAWLFRPGTRDGVPVEFTLKFRMNFAAGQAGLNVSAGSFTAAARPGSSLESNRSGAK